MESMPSRNEIRRQRKEQLQKDMAADLERIKRVADEHREKNKQAQDARDAEKAQIDDELKTTTDALKGLNDLSRRLNIEE